MKIVLASSNRAKIEEFRSCLDGVEIFEFGEVMEPFEIVESGESFKENALIKARAVYEKLEDSTMVVVSDDSGISVDILNHKPGIYSARYAGDGATSAENLDKLVSTLREKNIKKTAAYYTAAIAIVCEKGEFCVHGWMYGDVVDEKRGDKGFGYDPSFIPEGFDRTLGELEEGIKKELSHRSKALDLAKIILKTLV